jgi:hypothetical protein
MCHFVFKHTKIHEEQNFSKPFLVIDLLGDLNISLSACRVFRSFKV